MSDTIKVPVKPPHALLYSMALRYRHDFGLTKTPEDGPLSSGVTAQEKESILRLMTQLYEEATGQGFYQFNPE